ncbi:hypothetical protein ZIOFF_058391 [Zingiber officinale]|uniref:Expansin n=1 Tax=Zingiber officinale TaxID=94328 RepID=A0A8J5KAT2_ZINOF|nr:hypothetical protein ZIOFF_058391 [Zingiber officinale]
MEVALFIHKIQGEPASEMIDQAGAMAPSLLRQHGRLALVFLVLLLGTATTSSALTLPKLPKLPNFRPGRWRYAHATFYGDETASETMGTYVRRNISHQNSRMVLHAVKLTAVDIPGGACGFGNLFSTGYGTATAALSTVLYLGGFSCGQCFQIRCAKSQYCYRGSPIATITATNLCPPNWALPSNNGGWCNPPRPHFDMSKPAFMKIAQWRAGIVPVMYRRVPCPRRGGIRFLLQGNGYWLLTFVMNVGGAGDVGSIWVKGSKTGWMKMSHNWGASYQAFSRLGGQSLSFKVVSYSTKQTIFAYNVAPANWWTGKTYQARVNFK